MGLRDISCYIDWFPYDVTIKRAKIYFKSGKPFTNFSKVEKKYLEEILYIRNALTHRSNYSIIQLNRNVIKDLPLTSKEKTVTGFLRSFYVYFFHRNPGPLGQDSLHFFPAPHGQGALRPAFTRPKPLDF